MEDLFALPCQMKKKGDTYINDRLHYKLSVEERAIIADINHEINGLWYWTHSTPLLRGITE